MFNEVKRIVSNLNIVTKKKLNLVSNYIFSLTVKGTKHSFETMGRISDCDPSRFSHLLNHPDAISTSSKLLNRLLRRKLSRTKVKKGQTFLIFDATFTKRTNLRVENCSTYHSGSGYLKAHKWLNFILYHEGKVIPLASLPLYSEHYCKEYRLDYISELDLVVKWLDEFYSSDTFLKEDFKKIYFLADSGYDVKKIENKIISFGSHFVIALKSSRLIKGLRVSEYFRSHKKGHKAKTIRLSDSGKKRITFTVRLATSVLLKGVGAVNVVCSKGDLRGKRKTVKYIGSSDPRLKTRDIIKYYRIRWKIETWHKEVKQKFGFGDCACHRFSAVHAHVQYVLIAYLIQSDLAHKQISIADVISLKILKRVRVELTKIGQLENAKTLISEALQDMAA